MFQKALGPLGRTRWAALAAIVALAVSSSAQAAGLLIADGGFGGQLEIREQDVKVTINNGIAVTDVTQVFVNKENRIVEALYTFPVPKGASVANFSMWIGGKEMIGEVVEKERARQIYESYKQTKRDPGLLEQVDYKRFEMRIFPIPAGAEQKVKVTYYQELDFDHDWATYVYPLATNTESEQNQRTTGKFALSLDVKSEVPIQALKSTSHADDFIVVSHSENYFQASLETSGGDLSRDLVLAYETKRPMTGIDFVASRDGQEDGFFYLTVTAGEELAQLGGGMDYVFILDISGSMADDGKLSLSRNSLGAFIESLGTEDRFELVTFNVAANPLFSELRAADEAGLKLSREFLADQRARGGTVLRGAIDLAYRYRDPDRTLNVVLLSDGMTEQREQRELIELIGKRPAGTRVFCIGVGNEVNRPLLSQLANDAGGLAAFLSPGDDLERQAAAFRRKLMRPAASNVQIDFDGGAVYDVEPQQLGNLYHGVPLRLYGRYAKPGPVKLRVRGDIQGQPFNQQVEVEMPKADARNPEIERMWASQRVDTLLDELRRSGNQRGQDEIVRLCEGFSIVSEYASFIVLENDGEYQRWKIDRRNATRVERDRRAQTSVRDQLEQLRNRAAANIGPEAQSPLAQSTRPTASPAVDAAPSAAPATPRSAQPRSTPRDLNFAPRTNSGGGGGGGGGAIDPFTLAAAIGLAGAAAAGRRKRQGT